MRLMQVLLVLIAAGSLMFSGYSLGRVDGFEAGARSEELGSPRRPAVVQTVVLAVVGVGALAAAVLIGGTGEPRVPTPARLDELSGRAEAAARAKAAERPGP
jgi:hypothetical protein